MTLDCFLGVHLMETFGTYLVVELGNLTYYYLNLHWMAVMAFDDHSLDDLELVAATKKLYKKTNHPHGRSYHFSRIPFYVRRGIKFYGILPEWF